MGLRYILRGFRSTPGFAAVWVLVLALGIGANTAVFSLVHAVLLQPLPYTNPQELVSLKDDFRGTQQSDIGMSVPEMEKLRDRSGVVAEITAVRPISANLTGSERPERIEALGVSTNYFAMLGVKAQLGRVFGDNDRVPGFAEAVILSDGLWRRAFGGDPNILGKKLRLDNDLYTVAGVLPRNFRHPGRPAQAPVDIWITTGFSGTPFPPPHPEARLIPGAIVRLKPGLTIAQAQSRLEAFGAELNREYPDAYPAQARWIARLVPLRDEVAGHIRLTLLVVFGAVLFVLLICCTSVANLAIARAMGRQREVAVRRALGASWGPLVWQSAAESILLSLLGGAIGWIAVKSVEGLLPGLVPTALPVTEVSVNGWVAAFALGTSLLSGLISGLAPLAPMMRTDVIAGLRDGGRGFTRSASHNRLRAALVAGEIALSLMLMAGAGLLLRSFWNASGLDLGFNPKNVLVANLRLPFPNDPTTGTYLNLAARKAFTRELLRRVRELPGVESAAIGNGSTTPLSGFSPQRFRPEGFAGSASEALAAESTSVTPDFFHVLGTPLVRGRMFTESDEKGPGVVLVDQRMANTAWPNQDPIGKRFGSGPEDWLTVVGVVGDLKSQPSDSPDVPHVYFSAYQRSNLAMTLFVRTASNPASLTNAVRRVVQSIDPDQPVFGVRTLEEVVSRSLAQRRFQLQVIGTFALLALLLAAIGIYGVTSCWVRQRTQEIGIRVALGAQHGDVLRLVLRQGLQLMLWGLAGGCVGAVPLVLSLRSLLFGAGPFDPLTFSALILLLGATSLAACYLPARSAMRIDPIVSLRAE
jgi:putative ABC transport system permease protein